MTTIHSLPNEVLSQIFDYIDSMPRLAACRLVCRKWNDPAEKSMFGKKITIKSEKQAVVLYGCLSKDPSKGRWINHMDFNIHANELPVIYPYLLDLAITPSIEQLTGFVQAEEFFTAVGDIADKTMERFINLKRLPRGPNQELALQVLKRLDVRSLVVENNFRMPDAPILATFSSLTALEISGYKKEWRDLETILKHCPDLVVLKFVSLRHGQLIESLTSASNWHAAHVVKQLKLERLEFENSTISAEVAEYLRFKYPNIKVTKCDGYNASGSIYNVHHSFHRLLDALIDLHVEEVPIFVDDNPSATLKWSVKFTESRKEKIRFHIDQDNHLIMKVNFTQST